MADDAPAADTKEHDTESVKENADELEPGHLPDEAKEAHGIDETIDVLEAMQEVSGEVADLLDGSVGVRQFGTAAVSLLDDGYAAVKGAEEIPEEVGDLNEQEIKKLANEALKIVTRFDA
jgi:hypothetical protein